MMTIAGIIFANVDDYKLPELAQRRAISSVPFGGRFRLIDFALSNMVNSGISSVGLITNANYQSLVDHIGGGKDWDLARRSGGLRILPPMATTGASSHAMPTRLGALVDNIEFVRRRNEDYFVLVDGNCVCNMDYEEMVKYHAASGNDVTIVTHPVREPSHEPGLNGSYVIETDTAGRVTDITDYQGEQCALQISCQIMILSRQMLLTMLARATAHGLKGLYRDLLRPQLHTLRIGALTYEGYFAHFNSLPEYFAGSMVLLRPEVRAALFEVKNRPILTKVRNMPPTLYGEKASVKGALVADGCQIDGVVENCILFRGVHVGAGAVVRNSVLMQDTYVGAGAQLNCVVTDKNVVIRDNRLLSGHETMPFFICKNQIV